MREAEFEEWFKDKELETCDGVPMLLNDFVGVSRNGNKWRAQIKNSKLKSLGHLGYYGSPKGAALAVKRKRAELEEMFKGNDDSLITESVGKSASFSRILDHTPKCFWKDKIGGGTHFLGVSKNGNKWQARVRHPKLKVDIYCGRYSTPEEAAFVVEERKAELEEMLKSEDSSSLELLRDQFGRKKLPYGISWKNGRYYVRIWQPEFKKYALLGSYSTLQEATIVAKIKREEFKGYEVLQEVDSSVASESESLLTGAVNVPRGVRRIKNSNKWVARIRDPVSRSRIWLGTYNTVEEAISSFNKKKAEFAAKIKSAEFVESKVNEDPVRFGLELGYDSPTSSAGADDLHNIATIGDKSCRVVDIYDKLGKGLVQSYPNSVLKLENSKSAAINDETCGLEFDRAVSSGFINEYGQLMGTFSELDENMGLGFPDEEVTAAGYY